MDSSASKSLVDEEEAEKLRRGRISLKKAASLLGISYPTIRRYNQNRQIVTFRIGGQTWVNLTEVKRFLQFGNATQADWDNHERNQQNG